MNFFQRFGAGFGWFANVGLFLLCLYLGCWVLAWCMHWSQKYTLTYAGFQRNLKLARDILRTRSSWR